MHAAPSIANGGVRKLFNKLFKQAAKPVGYKNLYVVKFMQA